MPNIYYYGKKTGFVGKTLFEILANLRNFGINRMLLKQEEIVKNPGERCYYIVRKVEPVMDDKLQEGAIYAERVFKGAKVPGLFFVNEESWHTDWQLVPKDKESEYRIDSDKLIEHGHPDTVTVLPRWMEVPPLLDVYMRRHYKARGGVTVAPVKLDTRLMNIKMHYDFRQINFPHSLHRTAEEGEKSELDFNKPLQSLLHPRFRPENQNPKAETKAE